MTFRPMLAGKAPENLGHLKYPLLASPKLDGIRCLIRGGIAVSRNLKPIPNRFVQNKLAGLPDGFDGELMVVGGFNSVQSAIMSAEGEPDFVYWVFDFYPNPNATHLSCDGSLGFADRQELLREYLNQKLHDGWLRVHHLHHQKIEHQGQLEEYEGQCLTDGFEGVMVRDPQGTYKFGRSTTREGGLLKVKQFVDEEATVVGVVERYHNRNALERDNLGHAKRSSERAGMVSAGDLGALVCRTADGVEFQIGTGFTAEQRVSYWNKRETLIGRTVTFKHQPDPGGRQPGQAPRFPVFLGFRYDL